MVRVSCHRRQTRATDKRRRTLGRPRETNSIFTLDGLGRPYLITELVEFNEDGTETSERRRSFSLADGTPVVQIAQGCYRTAGRLPFVDLFSADADPRHLRYVSPSRQTGDPGWSGTDTAPLRSPRIQN